jgi:hypothetical protein
MLEQCDPERSWHILIRHRHAERSSLVGRFGSIREVGELESVSGFVLAWPFQYSKSERADEQTDPVVRSHCIATRVHCPNPQV